MNSCRGQYQRRNSTATTERLRLIVATAGTFKPVIADLTLGSWQPYAAANDIFAQLGMDIAGTIDGSYRNFEWNGANYGPLIATAIDNETAGDRSCSTTLTLATRVIDSIVDLEPLCFVFLLPQSDTRLEEAEAQFIEFFLHGIRGQEKHRAYIVDCGYNDCRLPSWWRVEWSDGAIDPHSDPPMTPASLIPGVIGFDLAGQIMRLYPDASGNLVSLMNGTYLVRPESRLRQNPSAATLLEHLKSEETTPSWLRAYAHYRGRIASLDCEVLRRQAWAYLSEGASGVALRLLERASVAAHSNHDRWVLQALLQGVRIATLRYADAASGSEGSPELPRELRSFLLQARGWGLSLTGRPDIGRALLAQAVGLQEENFDDDAYLYLLNIYALSIARSGDLSLAASLEARIEEAQSRRAEPSAHLEYINSLNMARLERYQKRSSSATYYYKKAFGTVKGAASDSDLIHENVCLARVVPAGASRLDGASNYWLRAALVFLACADPEALAPRVVSTLLTAVPSSSCEVVERISARLLQMLDSLSRGEAGTPPHLTFHFARTSPETRLAGTELIGLWNGRWGVLLSADRHPLPFAGENDDRLRSIISTVIAREFGLSAAIYRSVLVHDGLGVGIAETENQFLSACLRHGVDEARLSGRIYRLGPDHVKKIAHRQPSSPS